MLKRKANVHKAQLLSSQASLKLCAGRLEGGLLYTPSHLRSLKAQLQGALRATVAPCQLPALAKDAGIGAAALGGATPGGLAATLVEELITEGKQG